MTATHDHLYMRAVWPPGAPARCNVCGHVKGSDLDQCPEGAQALPLAVKPSRAPKLATVPRETLRLSVVDIDPDQPELPMT